MKHMEKRSKQEVRKDHWFLAGLFVLIAALAGVMASEMNYSAQSDEIFSLMLVQHSWGDMIRLASEDVHPPLYYMIVKIFVDCFGSGDLYRDVLIAKIISILPLWLLLAISATDVRKCYGRRTGILFAGFVIGFPSIIHISSLIRMYSWGLLFVTIAGMMAVSIMQSLDSKRTWIIFCISSIAACYTHYYCDIAIFYLYLLLIIYLAKRRRPVKRLITQSAIVVISFVPWLGVLLNQAKAVTADYWISKIGFSNILDYIKFYFAPYTDSTAIRIPLEVLMVLIVAIIVVDSVRNRRWNVLYLLSNAICVAVTGILISWAIRPVFVSRYVLPSCGLFSLGIAIGISYMLPNALLKDRIPVKMALRRLTGLCMLIIATGVSLIDVLSFSKNEIMYGKNFRTIRHDLIVPIQQTHDGGKKSIIITDSSYLYLALSYYIPDATIYSVGFNVTEYFHRLSARDNIDEYSDTINISDSDVWIVDSMNYDTNLLQLIGTSNTSPISETLEQEQMLVYHMY